MIVTVIILGTCKTERIVRVRTTGTKSHTGPRSNSKQKRIDADIQVKVKSSRLELDRHEGCSNVATSNSMLGGQAARIRMLVVTSCSEYVSNANAQQQMTTLM